MKRNISRNKREVRNRNYRDNRIYSPYNRNKS